MAAETVPQDNADEAETSRFISSVRKLGAKGPRFLDTATTRVILRSASHEMKENVEKKTVEFGFVLREL